MQIIITKNLKIQCVLNNKNDTQTATVIYLQNSYYCLTNVNHLKIKLKLRQQIENSNCKWLQKLMYMINISIDTIKISKINEGTLKNELQLTGSSHKETNLTIQQIQNLMT